MPDKPSVLFVCVHNAGRSQMAAAFLTELSHGAVEVRSAGSQPADQVNPAAVAAMAELGIDIAAEKPKILTDQAVRESDVVITMGCGDTCPFYPGKRYEDWVLEDPAGKGVESVRPIRDEIRRRVEVLVAALVPAERLTTMSTAGRRDGAELEPHDGRGTTNTADKPGVLFVCVKNGGKSQMAAGLMAQRAGDAVQVRSAGTKPGTAVNGLSAEALAEVGVDISGETPRSITEQMVRDADVVVTLGREAHVEQVPGTDFENWDTDEPFDRGIDGIERMRLVRDDIARRVDDLYARLTSPS